MRDVINISEGRNSGIQGEFSRESLRKIFVEYDSSEDLFNLKLSSTNELTPEEASCVVSLLIEAQRIRADYFKRNGKGTS